jgi:hypothetical protein
MVDKMRLLRDLLKLGVCYRARLSEQDLGVYAEMVDARMDDAEWAEVMAHYTGAHGDIGQEFMPTPLELIATASDFRVQRERKKAEVAENQARYLEREERRRALLADNDELLHNGNCPA